MSIPPTVPTILVVDDEAPVRRMIVCALETVGWTALEAPSGRIALALLAQHHVDLLLTDLVMPDGEGIELIMVVKKAYPLLPIVAISGQGTLGRGQFLDSARLLGARRTLVKPFEISELVAMVREVLEPPAPA